MATKSYKLRLDLRLWSAAPIDGSRFTSRREEVEEVRKWLDDTRIVFNEGVDYISLWLLKMHRGAGIFRERIEGIWGEWQSITTHEELTAARKNRSVAPEKFALIENQALLKTFMDRDKSESEAVELAERCRRIAVELCPASEGEDRAQMPRDDLDLLTLETSTAKGLRERGLSKSGEPKQRSGRRPRWSLKQALLQFGGSAKSWNELDEILGKTEQFQSAGKDGQSFLKALRKKHGNLDWERAQLSFLNEAQSWEAEKAESDLKTMKSTESGVIAAYRRLLEANCLPLPGLLRPGAKLGIEKGSAEWNYSMWNMAGQRVRSHLGWVRRRSKERLVWESSKVLFEKGGWVRAKRKGKRIKGDDRTPDDFRLSKPPEVEISEFEVCPGYGSRAWFRELRSYETNEMTKQLESMAFGAVQQLRVRKRTIKGWTKVRDKWRESLRAGASDEDLLEEVNKLRIRKPRDFGDQSVFKWLANHDRHWLWNGSDREDNDCGRDDRDCVTAFVEYSEKFAEKPDSVTFTRSNPEKHPAWPFFGENSAVKYALRTERDPNGRTQLTLVLAQLLCRMQDGKYSPVKDVKIALRGYEDFEGSFQLCDGDEELSPQQELKFTDDLLAGETRSGSLGGLKLIWDREVLENEERGTSPLSRRTRIFASFSCDVGDGDVAEWLDRLVVATLNLDAPRDGLTRASFLRKTVIRQSPTSESSSLLPPGRRRWPREALDNGLAVRGTDLGFRSSSAGVCWRLTFTQPTDSVSWLAGECDGKPVFAVWERASDARLPGDGEDIPEMERHLRERLYAVRSRLSLNNAILRIVRLLILTEVSRQVQSGKRFRRRANGTRMPVGAKWKIEISQLSEGEIEDNCRKAASQILRWADTTAMRESLDAIGHAGNLWDWLAGHDPMLKIVTDSRPSTVVPTKEEAKSAKLDRDAIAKERASEEATFAAAVHAHRNVLARALCSGYDAAKAKRAESGLWSAFDAALVREVSYSDRAVKDGKNTIFEAGLLRLLRKPPITKHHDRKDETNNLPHGETHRGGLSMARLNFLDDVKSFVKRWSCRPRWPGNIRRLAEDYKFDRQDTEHLDHIREHRAKLIAHADVAQALGFQQDLRRGVWLYRDKVTGETLWHRPEGAHFYRSMNNGLTQCASPSGLSDAEARHPHRAYPAAHVLVYEDLSRYKARSDRPRNENAGLARWSHRRILAFAQHIGQLFGLPVATVSATYSSRFCFRCGAPGCRVSRFDPRWLTQRWMQAILQSKELRDAAMKSTALRVQERLLHMPAAYEREEDRPWILRDGGTHFVCANRKCALHLNLVNADENAAANIGLRFLRGMEDFKVWVSGTGKPSKSLKYMAPARFELDRESESTREPFWVPVADGKPGTGKSKAAALKSRDKTNVSDSDDIDENDEESAGGGCHIFCDPSGNVRARDHWFERKVYWTIVAREAAIGIHAANSYQFMFAEDD